MKKILLTFLSFLAVGAFFAQEADAKLDNGIYAEFNTSKGKILCELEYQKVPMTVANFVGLAEGNFKVYNHKYDKPYYDGLKFHRVIKDFMIQGGDPQGNGMGGPKHKFYDEIVTELKHSGPGILSMANSGPNTNGSQFFITHKATPWLDGKHTVFGHVVSGQDVVNAIAQNDVMETVRIIRVGADAEKWNATEQFAKLYNPRRDVELAQENYIDTVKGMSEEEFNKFFYAEVKKNVPKKMRRKLKQTKSGLVYYIEKKGKKKTNPDKGDTLKVHCTGNFRFNGEKFFSTHDGNRPMEFQYQVQKMVPGFEEGLALLGSEGKGTFYLPYHLAYGPNGRRGGIPPYSDLVFKIELLRAVDGIAPSKRDHDGHGHDGHDHDHDHDHNH